MNFLIRIIIRLMQLVMDVKQMLLEIKQEQVKTALNIQIKEVADEKFYNRC